MNYYHENDLVTTLGGLMMMIPFTVFLFLLLFGRIVNRYRGIVATITMFLTFSASLIIFSQEFDGVHHHFRLPWVEFSKILTLSVGIKIDFLASVMLVIVSFISFLVHLFSIEYIRGDKNFEKYFAYLNLFTFSMFGIILADNLLQMFIFWELVGFCSYLLIGFWYEKQSAVLANQKAFIINRIGDLGFLFAILYLWTNIGSLDFEILFLKIGEISPDNNWLILVGLGLFCGCIGKSAQFPLFGWLPDAMEGPTPVSALIHAATMVAAGIFLLSRVFFLLHPDVLTVIAVIGCVTAFMGGVAALTQKDIKRVLAFSTISQLGYMVMAVGIGSPKLALFHLLTHAFFKACLFLCVGAVIHSMHHFYDHEVTKDYDPQDMTNMGGLRKRMPIVFVAYTVSMFALIGLPLFTGFLSKDLILSSSLAWGIEKGSFGLLIPMFSFFTALLTALYMSRQWFLVFFNDFKIKEKLDLVVEAPILMKIPIIILAFLSCFFVFSFNPIDGDDSWFLNSLSLFNNYYIDKIQNHYHGITALLSIVLVFSGVSISWLVYKKKGLGILKFKNRFFSPTSFFYKISFNNWYVDEFYLILIVIPTILKSKILNLFDQYILDKTIDRVVQINVIFSNILGRADQVIVNKTIDRFSQMNVVLSEILGWFDSHFIDKIVELIAESVRSTGVLLKFNKKGQVQGYLFLSFILFIALIIVLVLT